MRDAADRNPQAKGAMNDGAVRLSELRRHTENASRDAFALAREAADAKFAEDRRGRATALDRALDALVAPISALTEEERQPIVEAWNEARLDVAWVLASGTGPTSLRLGEWLRSERDSIAG
jgi:uncharacterized iron-regulated protein